MMELRNTIVANEWLEGAGEELYKVNPSTEAPLTGIRQSSQVQLEQAITAAHQASRTWRNAEPCFVANCMKQAATLLQTRKNTIASTGALESGITFSAIMGMIDQSCSWLTYYAGWVDKAGDERSVTPDNELHFTHLEPYGVIGVITPSNSTVSAMVLPPILASRNTVVFKTPEFTSQVMALFLKCFVDAGFPAGVINCVSGDAALGEALTSHPLVDKVHFTGSPAVGKLVGRSCAEHLKPCALELGGKSANIICPDADVDRAADMVFRALTRQSGQSCVAGTRVIVHESLADALLDKTRALLQQLTIGDAQDPLTEFGPVVSKPAYLRIQKEILRAQAEGDGICVTEDLWAGRLPKKGFFITPTIFDHVSNSSTLAQEETFGPVISFIRYEAMEEALAMANDSQYGLASYIQTKGLQNAMKLSQQLEAGIIWVNGCQGIKPYMPFGGIKKSGFGRVGGVHGMLEFMRTKSVWFSA